MRMTMMVVFNEPCPVLLRVRDSLQLQNSREFVGFGQQRGRLKVILAPFKLEELALLGGANRLQGHCTCDRRRHVFPPSIKKVEPETWRHVCFEYAQFDLPSRSFHQRTAVRPVRVLVVVIVTVMGVSVSGFLLAVEMTVVVTVRMRMRVAVWMRVCRAVGVRVFVFMRECVGVILFEMHVEFRSRDARPLPARHVEMVAIQTELRQLAFELFEVNAQVQHRPDEHVTADAAEDIEIKSFHDSEVTSNNQHSRPNIQLTGQRTGWMFGVECWLLELLLRIICLPGY